MNQLPIAIERDIHGGLTLFVTERDAVLHTVMDVARQVAPTVIAHVARAVQEYHENGGPSSAGDLDLALQDVPDHVNLTVLKLTPAEAMALAIALQYEATQLLDEASA